MVIRKYGDERLDSAIDVPIYDGLSGMNEGKVGLKSLPDLSASAPAIISLRSFEIWLVVKADCRDPSDSEVNGLCFDFLLILDVLLEN